ncbi:DUF1788 domain-containing protein [Faecalimonas sp.]
MMTTAEKLNSIEPRLKEKGFLKSVRSGHSVPFYILDYDPADEFMVREYIPLLAEKLNAEGSEITIKEFDLYNMIIECLESKGFLQSALKAEEPRGTLKLIEAIKNTTGLKNEVNMISDKFLENIEPNDVLIVTGVGKAYPILRVHKVLSMLKAHVKYNPLIVMYPGTYISNELSLFGEIDREYYQAFKFILEGDYGNGN